MSERISYVRSVSLGFWVGFGSRDEPPALAGASHFLEHLLFKGTSTRSARDISEAFEGLGAELNAFSAKEYTCYYSRLLDEHLSVGVEILTDMLQNATLGKRDIEFERKVILEEIGLREDTPDELIHDLFLESLWPHHPLGNPVAGRRETVTAMTNGELKGLFEDVYAPDRLVVAASGNVDHDELTALVAQYFTSERKGKVMRKEFVADVEPVIKVNTKKTEQAHIALGTSGLPARHPDRFGLLLVDNILGGGMSSRLFQEIREKRGLAYSVYSHHGMYSEMGYVSLYAGTNPANAKEVLECMQRELARVRAEGVTEDEFRRSQEHLKGQLVLALESTGHRMSRLGRSEISHGEILSLDQLVEKINAVTLEDANRLAREVFSPEKMVLAVIGPFEPGAFDYFGDGQSS